MYIYTLPEAFNRAEWEGMSLCWFPAGTVQMSDAGRVGIGQYHKFMQNGLQMAYCTKLNSHGCIYEKVIRKTKNSIYLPYFYI